MALNEFRVEIFRPPFFRKHMLDILELGQKIGKEIQYASMGRYALYHILKACNISGRMLVPAYICESILIPLRMLNIEPIFYDVDLKDLNADINSINYLVDKYKVSALLVASMYGNPANLVEIEKMCILKNILLVDDAAQSFGAKLDNRYLGTYGDAGFFSLSPGKPAAGHMGAFFWIKDKEYLMAKCNHDWFHRLSYLDFYFNRLYIYNTKKYRIFKILSLIKSFFYRFIDLRNDAIADFEKPILGGILQECLYGGFNFRKIYIQRFINEFEKHQCFRVVKAVRGNPRNHKFVIVAHNKKLAEKLLKHLTNNQIFSLNGYQLLTTNLIDLPNCREINGRIIEIPIENDEDKMNYLFEILHDFRG